MKSVITSATNFTFRCPDGMENCEDLHVYRDPEGRFSISTWSLSDAELAEIIRTRQMHITIWGAGMPPISPTIESPFT